MGQDMILSWGTFVFIQSELHHGADAAAAKSNVLKRPAANMLSGNAPKCPGIDSKPMLYKKGKISYSTPKGGWRVWVDKEKAGEENFVKGGPEQWQKVLDKFK